MTEKRFNSYCDNENIRIRIDDDINNKEVFHIYFVELDDALYCKSKLNSILDLLNSLNDENEQLKQEVSRWKKILDDYQQIVAETLREQYHWLKNEDKIFNHEKTVALLELESIATYLGVELE